MIEQILNAYQRGEISQSEALSLIETAKSQNKTESSPTSLPTTVLQQ
jgi:hypothetical protein